ncbi:unnamed protein product [Rotaria magnacalcarata]
MTSSRNHPVGKSEGGVMIAVKNHIKCSETLNETMCYNKIVAIELHATSSLNDHKPLTFELSIGMEPKPTSLRIQFNFKVVNWIKFRKILNEQLQLWDIKHTINTSVDIEECNAWITKSLLTETYQAIPKSKQANWNYTILGLGDRYG